MTPTLDTDSIPAQLTALEQWICWREDDRDGKPTKVPIKPYPTSGTVFASATDPGTWRGFETAVTYHRESSTRTDGVGFVFDPEERIVGVDLDHCRDADSEELAPWAAAIVDRLDSYTEVSPSGTGIHVLVEGELPPGRNRRGDVEMYDRDRFFTVTGAHLSETPDVVARRQDALLAVHHEFVQTAGDDEAITLTEATDHAASNGTLQEAGEDGASAHPVGPNSGLHRKFGRDPPAVDDPALEAALHGLSPDDIPAPVPRTIDEVAGPGVDLPDAELLRRATASKSGDTIQALLDGDHSLWRGRDSRYPSQSEADMGLCFYLAFWTAGDPERMDQLFRESGLMREKWDRRHYGNGATYGEVCIARTLLKLDDYYSPPASDSEEDDGVDLQKTSERSTGRTTPSLSTPGAGPHRSTEGSTDGTVPPLDMDAVEDAQRLATKVRRQQEQLDAYKEQIADLKTRLRWYRIALDLQSSDTSFSGDPLESGADTDDIDPRGEPAAPPEGDLDIEESRSDNRDVIEPTKQTPGSSASEHEAEISPPEDDGGSRLRDWLRRRWL